MATRANISTRLKKIETSLQPAQHIHVLRVFWPCEHPVDAAHAADVHAHYREGDMILTTHVYLDCPRCSTTPTTPRRPTRRP